MIDIKYDFSFTAASLRLSDMVFVAKNLKDDSELDCIEYLGNGNSKTGKRFFREFKKRISNLTKEQIVLLIDSDLKTQRQIAFLSVCKSYGFIFDFIIEVLREKILMFDYQITNTDYNSFFEIKCAQYERLDNLSDMSKYKIKQVMFKILEQAGIINSVKEKIIQPQILNKKLIDAIIVEDCQYLKVFFVSDMDIKKLNQ